MPLHEEEVEQRRLRWHQLWLRLFIDEVSLLRPRYQGRVHELLKRAYYSGTNDERRKYEPTQLGGCD